MKIKNGFKISLPVIIYGILILSSSCEMISNNQEVSYGSLTDQDGNTYKTVVIGTQTWMAENLKTTKYNNNDAIPVITSNSVWSTRTSPAYSWYDNDETIYKPLYGALYNWHAVNTGKLCPVGWHVPTDNEFKTFETYLGMSEALADSLNWRETDLGTQMKNSTGWAADGNGTNTSGFSALPGGFRYYSDGTFNNEGTISYWWCSDESSSTTGYYRRLDGSKDGIYRGGAIKAAGKYVRCVKD